MLIKYIGHACFKVRDNETGYSIVFDPYEPDSLPGYRKIVDSASEVICSHEHFDHNSVSSIMIDPKEESPYEVTFIDCYHDEVHGAKRGTNKVTIIRDKKTGEKLIHYGDLGENLDDFLTDERLELLKDADVALIPVGGVYTIDGDQAIELIRRTHPNIAVPMHYRSETGGFGLSNIDSIESFTDKTQAAGIKTRFLKMFFYDTQEYPMDACVLAIRPQNIY